MKLTRPSAAFSLTKFLVALAFVTLFVVMGIHDAGVKRVQSEQLAQLDAKIKEMEGLLAAQDELPKLRAQLRELQSVKKDTAEIHELRNEVRQLRDEKQQFAKAQAENAQLRTMLQQQAAQAEQARVQQQQAVANIQLNIQQNAVKNACISNLKQIDGAVQQWALENRKVATSTYALTDLNLLAFLRGSRLPACPGGGIYTAAHNVSGVPTCSILGHTL